MSEPLISVVMNCYNGEKFIREAINSLVAQTHSNWELVFWDNQSTDRSAEIAKSYGDGRIRYIRAPRHTTLGAARKLAVPECRGEFISFLDTDDLYLPDNLSRKLELIEKEKAAVVYGGVIRINEAGEEGFRQLPSHSTGMIFEDMLRQFETDVSTMMIRRSVLVETGLNFDDRIFGSEEYDLLLQLAVCHRYAVAKEYLAKVRHHRSSLTYKVMEKWAVDRKLTLSKIRANHPGIEEEYPAAFREACARAHYYEARWLVHSGKSKDALAVLRPWLDAGWRYRCLYVALAISPKLWELLHRFLPSARRV